MTALKRELTKRGILYDEDEYMIIMHGAEYDQCTKLVSVTESIVTVVWYSAVLDPVLRLYDRKTIEPVGEQLLHKETMFNGKKTWGSYGYVEEEENGV